MFPDVPLPDNSEVRIPVDAKLQPGWRYDAGRRCFISGSGDIIRPHRELPKGTRIVYKVPNLADLDPEKLSADERDLQRYMQIILPHGESAADYVAVVRAWACMEEAHVAPDISLP